MDAGPSWLWLPSYDVGGYGRPDHGKVAGGIPYGLLTITLSCLPSPAFSVSELGEESTLQQTYLTPKLSTEPSISGGW